MAEKHRTDRNAPFIWGQKDIFNGGWSATITRPQISRHINFELSKSKTARLQTFEASRRVGDVGLQEIWMSVHCVAEQTPVEKRRQLLRKCVTDLILSVDISEFVLVEVGAILSESLERDVDVLDLRVLARVLDLLDAGLVVLEQDDGPRLSRLSGVKLGVKPLKPTSFACGLLGLVALAAAATSDQRAICGTKTCRLE